MRILVDADACPVKEQIYRVAARYSLPVLVVANSPLRVPDQAGVDFVHVPGGSTPWTTGSRRRRPGRHRRPPPTSCWRAGWSTRGRLHRLPGQGVHRRSLGGLLATREVAQYLAWLRRLRRRSTAAQRPRSGRFAGKLDEVVNRELRNAKRPGPPALATGPADGHTRHRTLYPHRYGRLRRDLRLPGDRAPDAQTVLQPTAPGRGSRQRGAAPPGPRAEPQRARPKLPDLAAGSGQGAGRRRRARPGRAG